MLKVGETIVHLCSIPNCRSAASTIGPSGNHLCASCVCRLEFRSQLAELRAYSAGEPSPQLYGMSWASHLSGFGLIDVDRSDPHYHIVVTEKGRKLLSLVGGR